MSGITVIPARLRTVTPTPPRIGTVRQHRSNNSTIVRHYVLTKVSQVTSKIGAGGDPVFLCEWLREDER